MTLLALNAQIDDDGRGSARPVCGGMGNRRHRPARNYSSAMQGLPKLGRRFGVGHLPRVGWCFNTARDFLDFHALTRAGIRPDHAVALLSQSFPDQAGGQAAVGPEFHSVDRLSSVCVPDAPTPIGMAFANEQKDTAAGVKND